MYLTSWMVWIFSLSQDLFPSTSMIHFSTDLAALRVISRYRRGISPIEFWCMIVFIVPFAFLLAFMIRTCARTCCWNSALMTADAICSSICQGRGMLSSLLKIGRLSAVLEMEVGSRPGSSPLSPIFEIRCLAAILDMPGPMSAH